MNADDFSFESCLSRQWNRFGKLPRSRFNLVTLRKEPVRQCFEKWNVRRVCEIDPETHGSPLDLDQFAASTKRSLGGLDHIDHAQSRWSIRFRLLAVFDAIDKVQRFGL